MQNDVYIFDLTDEGIMPPQNNRWVAWYEEDEAEGLKEVELLPEKHMIFSFYLLLLFAFTIGCSLGVFLGGYLR